ncbi:hypothetical protein [uncultured Roseobacter sp.]|uniref:hypothetical protein n=1 Tax=uncultured Roseobacter sp. TaxID=114847 RepID=UPI002638C544|nr:hypothetical protein [uncultured Roseobacter sp.]
MLGVVLWSDASDGKAVIWCEDQGDLAFLNSTDQVLGAEPFFDAGDLVQFDMEVQSSLRRAHNPRLVVENAGASLPDALRRTGHDPRPRSSARVLPFSRREEESPLAANCRAG